jgi:hypothetical protein
MFSVHALGCAFGGPLATRHARVCGLAQSLKYLMFRDGILARAGLAPASDGRVEVTNTACVQRLSLRWGLLPRSDGASWSGRETLGRTRSAHSRKGALTVSQPGTHLEHARGPASQGRSVRGKGGGERVLPQHSRARPGKHLARGTAELMQVEPLTLPLQAGQL